MRSSRSRLARWGGAGIATAGELTRGQGRAIVAVAGLVPVVLALTQGPIELAGVLTGLLVGAAYSSPPLRLKRFPTLAALSISGVRAVVVNLVVFLHFSGGEIVAPVWALTLFVLPFGFAIAVLKDVPDAEGEYRAWFEQAGFGDVRVAPLAPEWHHGAYAVAVAGTKTGDGAAAGVAAPVAERVDEPMTVRRRALFAARFALGSLAGAAFIPIAVLARARRRRRAPREA